MSAIWPAFAATAALSVYLFLLFYVWFHWLARQFRRGRMERFQQLYTVQWFLFIAFAVFPVGPLNDWLRGWYGDHYFLRSFPIILVSFIPALSWWHRKRPLLQAMFDEGRRV